MKLNVFNRREIGRDFPAVREVAGWDDAEYCSIRRADVYWFLNHSGEFHNYEDGNGSFVLVVLKDGEVIKPQWNVKITSKYIEERGEGETVIEGLARMCLTELEVAYFIEVDYFKVSWDCMKVSSMTIFKLSKKSPSMEEVVKEAWSWARLQVSKESDI